jgi:DNA polymerase-3 subunit delta'
MWSRVIGQDRVKRILRSALENDRLPHAFLFHGNEGVGKEAMALELARVLYCETKTGEACGECASCKKVLTLQQPDLHFIIALPRGKNEQAGDPPLKCLTESEVQAIQEQLRTKGVNPYLRINIPRANEIRVDSIREVRRASTMSTFDKG